MADLVVRDIPDELHMAIRRKALEEGKKSLREFLVPILEAIIVSKPVEYAKPIVIARPAIQSVEPEDDSSFDFSDDIRITQGFKETEYDDSDEFKQ